MVHQDYTPTLPDIFPTGKIKVEDEDHTYRTFEGDGGKTLEEREYTLDKAPINEVVEVTGTLNGQTNQFQQSTDFELSPDNERIVWKDDPADRPDPDTRFFVTYRCESIMSRYLGASNEEFKSVDEELEQVIQSKFVDKASGDELDQLGALFGPVVGKRRGRTDTQYRIYLKSVVQSFISRGTTNGIKLAVSVATDVPVEDITIDEDFTTNEYEVVVVANTPVTGSLLEEIADIADPSGVSQNLTRFTLPADEMQVDDTTTSPDPSTGLRPQDRAVSDDAVVDEIVPDPKDTIFSRFERVESDDSVVTATDAVAFWGQVNWDSGEDWASENN